MIIVEGPDGAGKTTLARWIEEEYGLEYKRAPTLSSTKGPDEEAILWFEKELTDGVGVYDRIFPISEAIYSPATPGRVLMADERKMTDLMMKLMNRVQLLIFCLPPWPTARQNLYDVGRLMLEGVDENQLRKIHWSYEIFYNLYKEVLYEQVTMYDYTNMSLDHIKEAMDELATTAR